jgi:hypothetical protein
MSCTRSCPTKGGRRRHMRVARQSGKSWFEVSGAHQMAIMPSA